MLPTNVRQDYTSIDFSALGQSTYDNNKSIRRQSCWRYWNRLSSLQRSVICVVLIVGMLSAVYVFPSVFHLNNEEEFSQLSRRKHIEELEGNVAPNKENFAKDAISDIKKKAQGQMKKQGETGKRGPPSLGGAGAAGALGGQGPPAGAVEQQAPPPPDEEEEPQRQHPDQIENPKEDDFNDQDHYSGPTNDRQRAVVDAFKHAWSAYKKYAWGHDMLLPVSKSYETWFGLGLTLIDSLDTMYIMGLKDEFKEARNWVDQKLNLDVNKDVNLFECTIRVLGGLLSTYHLSGDPMFLTKATDLGDRLLSAFNHQSQVPFSDVNLHTRRAHAPRWGPDSSTSEVTTIQLEFIDLSEATGDDKYRAAVREVTEHVHSLSKKDGLVPIFISATSGQFRSSATITLGARGDSYYEYLLKQWLQSGKTDTMTKNDWVEAVAGMKKHLLRQSEPNKLTYLGELLGGHSFSPKMDHLVCFMGGALALGAHHGLPADHQSLGEELTETCWQMYKQMPTGLSPEIVYFNTVPDGKAQDLIVKAADAHNLERPETIESLFYLYRITGDEKYRDYGWRIFQSFEKYTKLPEGYSSINNVKDPRSPGLRNKMESFFLGETLKYFYLLFSDNKQLLDIDKWVFNTEAHPLPIKRR